LYKIPANTLFIGQSLVFMPECHSTNLELARIVQDSNPMEGMVVITDNQLSGKGQRGNIWKAEPKQNLTFSILLKPTFLRTKDHFQLSKAIALGVQAYCQSVLQHDVKIKWPNDILVQNQKVCGILIENLVNKNTLNHSVVGIGLNVNQKEFEFPAASSLRNFSGQTFDLVNELGLLLSRIESFYLMLRRGGDHEINESYSNSLYWRNEQHTFTSSAGEFEGIIQGVDASGRLIILSGGLERSFDVKEVAFTR
jgi:BirA family transcriptional regulator, biotin operon repressor / biotin---[acetyl-CoA-carboxylase] ligase